MNNRILQPCVVIGAIFLSTATVLAANETWVSGTGDDGGNCHATAPCRTFAFALGKTSAGGTINVLSSGNFGPLDITKAVSIVADGVEAVINTAGRNPGVRIQVGSGQVVVLRGLTIRSVHANAGISFVSGAGLKVEKCAISGGSVGISFSPTAGVSELSVSDTTVTGTSSTGVSVLPFGSGGARVAIERVRVQNSGSSGFEFDGLNTSGSINATLRDCVASGNNEGISVDEANGGTTQVMVDRCASVNNGIGIDSEGPGAAVRFGDSVVVGNSLGLNFGFGATLESYGTNKVDGNTNDGAPSSTISKK